MLRRTGDPASLGRPYLPVLLLKRGERTALERLSEATRNRLTPYIRVVPPELRRHDEDDPPPEEIGRLARVTGDHAVYLDAAGSPRRDRRRAPLGVPYVRQIYEAAVASSLAFAPVYPFGRRDLAELVSGMMSDSGAAVLVTSDAALVLGSRGLEADLREEVRSLGVEPKHLDAVVDLGYLPAGSGEADSVAWLVEQVTGAAPWRSVVLAATSIPDSVAGDVPAGSLGAIERREWALFEAVESKIRAPLRFGDYGVQHSVPPPSAPVPKMHASIRYTAGHFTYISRGDRPLGTVPTEDVPGEYREVAARLVQHPLFFGSECCWGDRFVEELGDGRRTERSQQWMRGVATCHHLTVVGEERDTAMRHATAEKSRAQKRVKLEFLRSRSSEQVET